MRGGESAQESMFSYVSLEDRVPRQHPLRKVRRFVDEALAELSPGFTELYSTVGRPSIPPEHLLRALLLQALYSIRSERQLMEHLDYNLLYRWFVGLAIDDKVWNHASFSKNRDRLLKGDVASAFFKAVLGQARRKKLLSNEHFTVDGTRIEAWASHKSFRPKDDPPDGDGSDFHGQKRSNATHESTTDPDSRLARKGPGKEAKLSFLGNLTIENRNGLIVNTRVKLATGTGEIEAAVEMLSQLLGNHRVTVGADKGYDNRNFVDSVRGLGITPHVAQNTKGGASRIDGRTTRHPGYGISMNKRPRVEAPFGWLKEFGLLRRPKFRGLPRIDWAFTWSAAAYNLIRMTNLETA